MTDQMKPPASLAEGWANYRAAVELDKTSPVQQWETEKAFYAGAATFFDAFQVASSDPGLEPTDEDVARVEALHQELVDFATKQAREILARKAGRN